MMSSQAGVDVMFNGVDHDGISGDPRCVSAVVKADIDTVCMHPYCDVDLGLEGGNFEQIMNIAAATDNRAIFRVANDSCPGAASAILVLTSRSTQ